MKYEDFLAKLQMAAAQKAIDRSVAKLNATPREDFCGLSPVQLTSLIHGFDSAESPVRLRAIIPEKALDSVQLFRVAEKFLQIAVRDGKLELTQNGYFKQRLLQEVYDHKFLTLRPIESGQESLKMELDWPPAHTVHGIFTIGKWIRVQKGNAVLTKLGKELALGPRETLFRAFFHVLTLRLDWTDPRDPEEFRAIQDCIGFSYWLIHKFGGDWRTIDFYTEKFLTAFPAALPGDRHLPFDSGADEIIRLAMEDTPGLWEPEDRRPPRPQKPAAIDQKSESARMFKLCFEYRTFAFYLEWLGFVETQRRKYPERDLIRRADSFNEIFEVTA